MTRVRKQAAMRTIFALAIAIPLTLALVDPAAAAVGMPWPYVCNYWPGRVECGTLSSPPPTPKIEYDEFRYIVLSTV